MKTALRHFLRALPAMLCGFAHPVSIAADAVKAMPQARDTGIVPYDPKKPLAEQKPDRVYLDHGRFLELWEAAKRARTPEKAAAAGISFAIGSSRYEGRVEEKRAAFTAVIELTTFNEPWVRVPLPFRDVQVSEMMLDGKPAPLAEGALLVEQPGRHTVTAKFEIPLVPGARDFAWGIPLSAATRLVLAVPGTRWQVRVQPDAGVIESVADGATTVTAALGTTETVRVSLVERAAAAQMAEPGFVQVVSAVAVSQVFERAVAAVRAEFPGAQQDRFSVRLSPKGAALAGLDARGLRSWTLRDEGDGQVLEFVLNEPAKDGYKFTVTVERQQAVNLPADSVAPWIDAGGRRREFIQELYAGPGVAVKVAPGASLRQTERNLKAFNEWAPVGAWTGGEPLRYRVQAAAPSHEARADYVYQVNRRKIELIASLKLHAKGGPLHDATLTLPEGFDVQAVDGDRLQDWWRDGQKLRARFRGATPESTPLVVYLVREYAAAPQQLDLRPLTLDGFSRVTGEAVIAAHKGVDATLKLGGTGVDAREIAPGDAARDFQILPPLERKRGFSFKNQAFTGEVVLAALPVKMNTTWMLHAQAFEAWASLSLKAQITLRQGSIERATFSLPSALPEARVTGAEVRETRSRVEGGRRIYEVSFQNDVYDTVDFTADVDVTMVETKQPGGARVNELALPAPEFPGAQLVTGYVLADNASEYEMKLATDGVEQAVRSEIPWLPSLTKGAGVFRVQPAWKVSLAMERLEKAEARPAFCAWAEMTTAVRNDGTEWHRAVWRLQNRSLQFLPVKLPGGAVLVGARVAGQAVRADSGTAAGGAVILVPLIKTKPGDVSYDVEVVWRSQGARLDGRGKRKYDGAELPGITVEQTFWSVWLPGDRDIAKKDGNMQEVVEIQRDIEKLKSEVEELSVLESILGDEKVSQEVWFNAKRNWDMVYERAKNVNINNGSILSSRKPSAAPGKDAPGRQEEEQISKLSDANTYLGGQLDKLAEDNKRIQQRMHYRVQVGATGNFSGTGGTSPVPGGSVQQAQVSGNAAQVLLFGNNTYTGATNIETAQLDVSSIVNAANGQPMQQVQGTMNQRWFVNPGSAKMPAPTDTAPPVTPPMSRNFYVNDNIVLQQEMGEGDAAKKSVATKIAGGKPGFNDGLKQQTMPPLTAAPETKAGDEGRSSVAGKKGDDIADRESGRGLNTARGNRLQQIELSKSGLPRSGAVSPQQDRPTVQAISGLVSSTPPPVVEPKPANLNAPAADQAVNSLERDQAAVALQRQALMPGADGTALAQGGSNPAGIQPQGRLSLNVDFPTEGRAFHFQKVKAAAVLELTVADPVVTQRWIRSGIFAALALALWFVGRTFRRRERA